MLFYELSFVLQLFHNVLPQHLYLVAVRIYFKIWSSPSVSILHRWFSALLLLFLAWRWVTYDLKKKLSNCNNFIDSFSLAAITIFLLILLAIFSKMSWKVRSSASKQSAVFFSLMCFSSKTFSIRTKIYQLLIL